ncbi:MAG: sugar phosphate isomerase/epimerase [Candidatus Bathyarchaeota archaeon]|nr:sugar phosphate isomerase/epimerase [Candidatus Bathyarchaeota archaeon]
MMRVSVTTDMFNYSFNPGMKEKLGLFKKHGFDYIHWCDNWDDDVLYTHDDMKKYCKLITDTGLKCLDVHGTATKSIRIDSFNDNAHRKYVELLRNRIVFCAEVEGDAVVVHPPRYHQPDLEKRVQRSYAVLEAVKSLCVDHGVHIAFENCYKDDHQVLRRYFEEYPPEWVGFCYDSGHANNHGNLDEVMGFKDRLIVTHLHDNKGDEDSHQPPGCGTVDWGKVKAWLKGYMKPLNLEVTHDPNHFDGSMTQFLEATVESVKILGV